MPLVSVIIPTYNRADVLGRAVRSVLCQTFKDLELIVVDDGSTDSTCEVLGAFDRKVRTVSQPNRGVSAARNAGIAKARGELLAFLDSDDEWMPEKLARQTVLYPNDDAYFICHTDEIWLRNGKEVPQKSIHRKQGGWFFERALERCLISPSSVMISRRLLDQTGSFDEDLCAAEDYDLWLRITGFYAVDFVPEPLVVKHGDSPDQLSRTIPAIDRFRIKAMCKIIADSRLRPSYRRSAVEELIRKCHIVAAGALKKGKHEEAEEYLELARTYQNCPPEPARG